jgi:hypothetical protein
MDHTEARELLELAALEPGGLERLTAGDTPVAAALAGHLVACDSCADELGRLRRIASILRASLADDAADDAALADETARAGVAVAAAGSDGGSAAPPELRDRTLAYVRELGRPRTPAEAADATDAAGATDTRDTTDRRWSPLSRWLGVAAAIVLAVGLGGLLVGLQYQPTVDRQQATIAALARVSASSMRVAAQPDARTVALTGTPGADATGRLVFSPSSGELVVMANGVAPPPAGWEYGCWVEVDGERRRLGRMYVGGDVGYWAGSVDGLADLPAGAIFGVSLVDPSGGPDGGTPILLGTL